MNAPEEGDLRVWHIPQVPGEPFHVPVKDLAEAVKIVDVLGDYDRFQIEHNIRPDYASTSGLNVFEDGEWVEWYDERTGWNIHEYSESLLAGQGAT